MNGVRAGERDGIAVWDEPHIAIEAMDDCEIVLVDLA